MTDPDPRALATQAAARALRDRLEAAGWDRQWPVVLEAVPVLAEVATAAAWREFKREVSAWQRPTPGALLDPADVTVVTDGDGVTVGYRYEPKGAAHDRP